MKTIISGSREGITYADVQNAVAAADWEITEVIYLRNSTRSRQIW